MRSITQVLNEGLKPYETDKYYAPKHSRLDGSALEPPKHSRTDGFALEPPKHSRLDGKAEDSDFQRKMDLYKQEEAAKAAAKMTVDTKDNKKEFASDYAREKNVAKKFPEPSLWDQAKEKITKFDAENPNAKWYAGAAAAAGLGALAYKKIKNDRQMKKTSK